MKLFITTCLLMTLNAAQAFDFTPNELIVKLKPGQSLPKLPNVKSVQNLFENVYVLRTTNLLKLEAALKNNPSVIYTERNHHSERRVLPKPDPASSITLDKMVPQDSQFNDPLIGKVWSFLDAKKNGVSVNEAYKEYGTTNTTPVIVAVVDTGVDIHHEDLKDVIWVNKKEIPGNGIDDDGNGYIDDINGINTLVRDANGLATMDNKDTHSHGTHVSGTIGAKQNNGIGIAGIASNVLIMGIRTVPNEGDETDIDVAEAFVYAARNGARIINCSFGKSSNEGRQLIPDTLKYIGDKFGVLVIAAAGNDSSDIDKNLTYPASFNSDNLLIIASTTNTGGMSYFSNYGKINVDVAAPGSNVYSTVPGNKYESMSGTSMATPTTVGVAAEILSHNPDLTVAQLKDILIRSVTKIDSFKNKMVSGGRIDLLKGLELAKTIK
ncbi:MAG: S8 family serine peptidase [Bacteriovorax sp.]|nr:S8 family serine peptidase [Bacteriovorax sp.]